MTGVDEPEGHRLACAQLILRLRQFGVTHAPLLRAIEATPHEAFVPEEFAEHAYRDVSLPIACGQSMTSPVTLARMIDLMGINGGVNSVLEIGTGSGYAAALLSKLSRRVFTMDRYRTLLSQAETRWQTIGCANIVGLHGDGFEGLVSHAPFDRILVTGSITEVPEILIEQLADDGVLVAPLGEPNERQILTRFERVDDTVIEREGGQVRLSALVQGKSRAL
ncbi:protein-L-isoaspartate(D-aspartate) O-methyltransferase [Cucumibacter marinus]|uniref:protein-L-isoaspartate(D-aspartate) O-methyltransferase n=1 Tax=Cucumibacter marinus TaxID=1121252 RepID=UPI0004155528|nr:protein-L-isoaspartate(D-aspartate) O-methyltransferase [Cucumibacter marinus]